MRFLEQDKQLYTYLQKGLERVIKAYRGPIAQPGLDFTDTTGVKLQPEEIVCYYDSGHMQDRHDYRSQYGYV
eukprot:COSAG04_NODE_29169_length_270_cov_1.514620_1_plen_71_part_01